MHVVEAGLNAHVQTAVERDRNRAVGVFVHFQIVILPAAIHIYRDAVAPDGHFAGEGGVRKR